MSPLSFFSTLGVQNIPINIMGSTSKPRQEGGLPMTVSGSTVCNGKTSAIYAWDLVSLPPPMAATMWCWSSDSRIIFYLVGLLLQLVLISNIIQLSYVCSTKLFFYILFCYLSFCYVLFFYVLFFYVLFCYVLCCYWLISTIHTPSHAMLFTSSSHINPLIHSLGLAD